MQSKLRIKPGHIQSVDASCKMQLNQFIITRQTLLYELKAEKVFIFSSTTVLPFCYPNLYNLSTTVLLQKKKN